MNYSTPSIKIVEFSVECGFDGSVFKAESSSTAIQAQPEGKGEVMSHNDWGTF